MVNLVQAGTTPDTQDPLYIGYGRESSQPHGDESGKILGQTVGEALTEGGKLYDQHIKKTTDEGIHTEMDALQDERITNLTNMFQQLSKGTIADADGNPVNVTSLFQKPESQRTPEDLKNIGTIAENLRQGRAHGVYDDNYYQMRKNEIAKKYRTLYPGYRDYIDAKFKDAEGSTANELAQSLIKSTNDLLANKDQSRNKLESQLIEHLGEGPSNQPDLIYSTYINWKAGKLADETAWKAIADVKGQKWRAEQTHREMTAKEAEGKDTSEDARKAFNSQADNIVGNNFNIWQQNAGSWKTAKEASDALDDWHSTGFLTFIDPKTGQTVRRRPTSTELLPIGQMLQAARDKTAKDLQVLSTKREIQRDADGKVIAGAKPSPSFSDRTKTQDLQTTIKDKLAFYDQMLDSFYKGEGAVINYGKTLLDTRTNDGANSALEDPHLGPPLMKAAIANKLGGPNGFGQLVQKIDGYLTEVTGGWREYTKSKAFDLINNPQDRRVSLQDAVSDAAVHGKKDAVRGEGIVKSLLEVPKLLGDKSVSDQGKQNIIDTAYNPDKNADLMKSFKNETIKNGKVHAGKFTVYSDLYNSVNINEGYRLGQRDGKSWNYMKDNAQQTAIKYMIPNAIKDLQEVREFRQQYNFAIGYSDKTHHLYIKDGNNPEANLQYGIADAPKDAQYSSTLQRGGLLLNASIAINRINKVNDVLANIANVEHSDPNEYIYNTLQKTGYDTSDFGKEIQRSMNFTHSFNPFSFKPEKKTPGVNAP